MSKDEALEKLVLDNVAFGKRGTARVAWRAAVKHTLAFVAAELMRKVNKLDPEPRKWNNAEANGLSNLAYEIERMKP